MQALSSLPTWYLYFLVAIFGAIFGSFLNVCIVRIPKGESIVTPRSKCFHTGKPLAWWENIPLVSYLLLRGKSRHNGMRIPLRYPLVELISLLLALLTWHLAASPLHFLLYFCFFVAPLIAITFIDLEHFIIPDVFSLPGIAAGIIITQILSAPGTHFAQLISSGLGILIGAGFLFLIAFLYEKIKKQEGLGGGDIKLAAMFGAFFGWKGVLFILLFSSIIGSIVGIFIMIVQRKNMKLALPFGPFLSAAALFYLYFGREILHWYLGFYVK
ncbi:MAG: prepilin peptidase [Deltaproteobacteria bacterium CG_4_10_14_0_2_um_filter_43_8]|nr:MAG: prepilin peptidase [Deltaproteobacteria bacterium CG11_big_fil_rev_8_21_14_0_20_42_23]PJA20993.1 MAG: prepilin peptidase [Deltaproteobacteria bacterium CG_4_10_14_0_2_um_filter_43_8]PJC63681.1 MAG: prepilin peptidase [Deltaproteobacteria bacterium CG_4_9_14_0_2_um_filter_42_21]